MTAMPRPLPHVVQISFFSDPEGRSPAQLLDAWPTLVDVAEAACRSGIRVTVVQASSHSEHIARQGVRYYFLPFGHGQRADPENGVLGELLRSLAPDVFHVHGLGFPRDVLSLASLAPGVPIILQDHANRPPRIWRRALWRREISVAAGITFCSLEQARPFADAGLIYPETQLYEIPESTSRFAPGDRQEARRLTGLKGDPAVLWVGHLNANKDPLTVLEGISAAARKLPQLQLYCCFGAAPQLRGVQDRIATDPDLRDRVHLLGRVPHERIEKMMRAADLFVLGSHHEGSGYSLIEALACGLPPVVTDIPSFRSLTGAGAVGMLWPCGDPRALCDALQSVAARIDSAMRAAVRAHFDRQLSFESLGLTLAAMYEDVLGRKRSSGTATQRQEVNGPILSSETRL
jgi:glycosyltransferase involved in cell wall biosynthesis